MLGKQQPPFERKSEMSMIADQQEVLRLARDGSTVAEIARRFRRAAKQTGDQPLQASHIRAWIKNAGLPIRKKSR